MELKGKIAAEDLIAAQWVHVRPRRSLGAAGILLLGLVAVVMATLLLRGREAWMDPTLWILLGILAYLVFAAFVLVPRNIQRTYSQRKDFQHEISMIVVGTGVETRTEQGYGVKPWSDYLKWKEGKTVFLLYFSDHFFQVVPKRFFVVREDIDAFRNLIKQSIAVK